MTDLHPETGFLPWKGKYCPTYRLRPTDRWRAVTKLRFDSAIEAFTEAKAIVNSIMNPAQVIEQPDDMGASEWVAGKQERHELERKAVFGGDRPATVFPKGRKPVSVEYVLRRSA